MRKRLTLTAIAAGLVLATPAHATGGLLCKTADGSGLEIALGFGHVPGAPLIGTQLRVKGKAVPVNAPQWWFDGEEMRLVLTDKDALNTLAVVRTKPNGRSFDGTVEWAGKSRWIRCYEN